MGGCRPLSDDEVRAILKVLSRNTYPERDRALFLLGIRSGFRISELLALKLSDVLQNGKFSDYITVARKHMKKKRAGRTVPLHPEAKTALQTLVKKLLKAGHTDPNTFLFLSREGENRAIGRTMAWRILDRAYAECGLTGRLGTHSMRKTFAERVHEKLGRDIFKTQKALGHASVSSTASYISVDSEEIDDAILKS